VQPAQSIEGKTGENKIKCCHVLTCDDLELWSRSKKFNTVLVSQRPNVFAQHQTNILKPVLQTDALLHLQQQLQNK